jgi:AAA family ATP:ADP antiporter
MFHKIKSELYNLSRKQIFFALSAMICGFLICAEYAIIRPASNSLFIFSYSASAFPYAWLIGVPINLLVVYLYNRFLPRLGCMRMFVILAALIGGGNFLCALTIQKISFVPFAFYVWKEIYIMLMLQQLWSVIHATIEMKQAKYLYGILFGIGGLGGVLGSMIPGFTAVKFGSENLLFLSLPIYAVLVFFYSKLLKHSSMEEEKNRLSNTQEAFKTLKSIRSSSVLIFILSIVMLMQMSSTIIDFQFNTYLEKAIPHQDLRTEYVGKIMGVVNFATILLQFVGSFLFLRLLGLRASHFAIPSILGFNAVACLFSPMFGLFSYAFATIKSFDFSVFNILKEMLYIPLTKDEKFRCKAVIDVFAYRSAKAFSSLLILGLQGLLAAQLMPVLSYGLIFLFALWSFLILRFFRHNQTVFIGKYEQS